jgi:transcription elongation factor GreB
MSKAFAKEEADDQGESPGVHVEPSAKGINYITPWGYARLKKELDNLASVERPEVVKAVSWAASNGDRSENGDYLYGKKRLREIDRRIRFLIKRMEAAQVVNPLERDNVDQAFFGATVTYSNSSGEATTVAIVGTDEVNSARQHVSWVSPIAQALFKAREGDLVMLRTPAGMEELEVLEISYQSLADLAPA